MFLVNFDVSTVLRSRKTFCTIMSSTVYQDFSHWFENRRWFYECIFYKTSFILNKIQVYYDFSSVVLFLQLLASKNHVYTHALDIFSSRIHLIPPNFENSHSIISRSNFTFKPTFKPPSYRDIFLTHLFLHTISLDCVRSFFSVFPSCPCFQALKNIFFSRFR